MDTDADHVPAALREACAAMSVEMQNILRSADTRNAAPPQKPAGRTLVVGREISLSGEIRDCERLLVEGAVEAALIGSESLIVAEGGSFRGMVKEIAGFDDTPQVVAVLHRMLGGLPVGGSSRNAFNYLEALPELARVPDDGAKAGEAKFSFGFGYKDVLKVAAHSPGRNLLSAIGSTMTPMQFFTALSEMEFKFHMHTSTQHKDDMLINMTQSTETKAHAFSYDLSKTENKSIKVTRAP